MIHHSEWRQSRLEDARDRGFDPGERPEPPTSAERAEFAALPEDDPWKVALREAAERVHNARSKP